MNILVDGHVFDDKYQGTRSYLKGLYLALIPICKDWNFFIAASNIDNLKKEFGEFDNLQFVPLKRSNKFHRLIVDFPSIIRRYDIDYSHFQYTIPPIIRGKYIVTVHDILFEQKEFKSFFPLKTRIINHFLHKLSSRKADVLLTVSEFSKQKILEFYKINAEDIFVTPNAVNDDFYLENESYVETPSKYIMYVSRIEPRKNHLSLLQAFTELKLFNKGYKLVYIGKRDISYPEFENYINSNKELIGDSLICIENVATNDLIKYYKNCDLFVFPSFAEGFGIPPLEAMVLEKKVLCSNRTAMTDFDLPNEFLFDPYNLDELKSKIINQLNSNFNLAEIYSPILSKYNWPTIAEHFKKIIDSHHKNQ
ncbi:glycosyltransferase family 4 protein [Bizionia arctica]|uniref:Glycosyl transferase n=1 Tax=Bizionia arctica TaxID=1495645 RepID=A0A917GBY6_9FLAO|nr:glycosyltransferase family 1 protein [Bizionia arctica]GGG36540.1 glycosyl transferase [Bizionia arctica]